jgi:hypothetical protein
VLLDEADVFLAQRDSTDVQRNALVSIFLRKLEYYQGILILTTNLITHCDIAFESAWARLCRLSGTILNRCYPFQVVFILPFITLTSLWSHVWRSGKRSSPKPQASLQ